MIKSYKAEVIADSSGEWVGNALRFKTKEEAEKYAMDLSMRWTAVRDWRVVESKDKPDGPELGISTPGRRYTTHAQERAEEKKVDLEFVGNFSEGDKVTVDRAWKRHWTFKEAPAPTRSLWVKLIDRDGVVHGIDSHGNVYVMDRFDQFTGGGGFPVPARFVRKLGDVTMSGPGGSSKPIYNYGDRGVDIKLRGEYDPPGVFWTNRASYVLVNAQDPERSWRTPQGIPVDLVSVNGIGEIRWSVSAFSRGPQGDEADAIHFFSLRK